MRNYIYFTDTELATELWRPVKDFEGYYEVSNLGRIRSCARTTDDGKCLQPKLLSLDSSERYVSKGLYKQNISYNRLLHRLVAEAFVPNPHNKSQVNHIDGDTRNNRASNLEWVTPSQNIAHSIDTGLRQSKYRKCVKCLETGQVFESMSQAAKFLCTDTTRLSESIKAKRCCKGYTFIFIADLDEVDEATYILEAKKSYQGWHVRPNMPNALKVQFSDGRNFDSLKEASRALNCDPNTIKSHCQSGKPYKGVTMSFKD